MRKKSQITVFIILGLVFLLIVVMLVELRSTIMDTSQASQSARMNNLVILKKSVNDYVESTIRSTFETGLSMTGFSGMDDYLDQHLAANLGFDSYPGVDSVGLGAVRATFNLSDDHHTANIHVYMPLNITSGGQQLSFTDFFISYGLMDQSSLQNDDMGRLNTDFTVQSTDAVASLNIPEGSVAVEPDGQHVSDVSMTVDDISDITPGGLLVFRAYDLQPNGAEFFPAAQLKMHYDESMLPPGADEHSIRIMQVGYDGTLAPVDSTLDTVNNVVTGPIYHFSRYVLVADHAETIDCNMVPCLFVYHGIWNFRDRLCLVGEDAS